MKQLIYRFGAVATRKRMLGVALLAITVAVVCVSLFARASSDATASDLSSVSTRGVPVAFAGQGSAQLKAMDVTDLRMIGKVGERAFYRFLRDGTTCFAVGDATTPGELGVASCGQAIIAQPHPVLDFSIIEMTRDRPEPHLYRLEGIAADGVAMIEVTAGNGTTLTRVPVQSNVFSLSDVPDQAVGELVARDSNGNAVYRKSFKPKPGR
jgi:hypothetical protein